MLEVLKAFGRYVPRSLVMRLIKEGGFGAGTTERAVAIMFTDIVSFTAICEKMTAIEVAAFINHHLTLISACVEHEGGTIDKFIGDAVMAFWGAPARMDNPAAAACRAAIAIQAALAADNKQRAAAGLAPVRIRIGIHMGPVVVGDIGAPNRINYTIVGDAVNATQRLESLGKDVDPDAEAIVLVSSDVVAAAPGFRFVERGAHRVKGKQQSLDVYQLAGTSDGNANKATVNNQAAPCSVFAADECRRIRSARSSPGIWPFSTIQRPPTMTRSARWAPQRTSAASGSPLPEKRNSSSLNKARSAISADGDLADVAAAGASRRAFGRPTQRVEVAHLADAVPAPLQQERSPDFLHQIGSIVRCRAVDAKTDADACSSMAQTGQAPEASV